MPAQLGSNIDISRIVISPEADLASSYPGTNMEVYPDVVRSLHDPNLVEDGSNPNQADLNPAFLPYGIKTTNFDLRNTPDLHFMVGLAASPDTPKIATVGKQKSDTVLGGGPNDMTTQERFITKIPRQTGEPLFPKPPEITAEDTDQVHRDLAALVIQQTTRGDSVRKHIKPGALSKAEGVKLAQSIALANRVEKPSRKTRKAIRRFERRVPLSGANMHIGSQANKMKASGNKFTDPAKDSDIAVSIQKHGFNVLPKSPLQKWRRMRAEWAEDERTAAAMKLSWKKGIAHNPVGSSKKRFHNPLKPTKKTYNKRFSKGNNVISRVYTSGARRLAKSARLLIQEIDVLNKQEKENKKK